MSKLTCFGSGLHKSQAGVRFRTGSAAAPSSRGRQGL
jgi:hypothetical protein